MATTLTRRDVLKAGGVIAGTQILAPIVFRGSTAWATPPDPATANRLRLVLIDLGGGNDGLNTIVPLSGTIRDVYDKVRPIGGATNIARTDLKPLGATNGGDVGLNPYLTAVGSLWDAGRVAVVQGVEYPNPNYSHFVSEEFWMSGEPNAVTDSGWLGRHLDRTGIGTGEIRGAGVGFGRLPLALRGRAQIGEEIDSLADTQFLDGGASGVPGKRHAAYAQYGNASSDPASERYGDCCADAVAIADECSGLTAAQPGGLSNQMLTARALLAANLGVEVVIVRANNYDTHDNQRARHHDLMRELDEAIEVFWNGTENGSPVLLGGSPIGALDPALASRVLMATFSEFGRRMGDNGSGTDHGAAAPMLLIGPPPPVAGTGAVQLVPGLHSDHPNMGTTLAPVDNMTYTTDVRNVYQAMLTHWLADPTGPSPDEGDPLFAAVNGPGSLEADGSLAGLFTTA